MLEIVKSAIWSSLQDKKAEYSQTTFLAEAAARSLASHRERAEKLREEIKELESVLAKGEV